MATAQEWKKRSFEECDCDLNKQIELLAHCCAHQENTLGLYLLEIAALINAGNELLLNNPGSDDYARAGRVFQAMQDLPEQLREALGDAFTAEVDGETIALTAAKSVWEGGKVWNTE